jgi:SAM-dependent methyltransferase
MKDGGQMANRESRGEWAVQGFGNGSLYDSARPEYPAEAVEFLVATLELDVSAHVLDLGAGSGIFSRQLLPYVARVTAVDPSESMRAALRETSPRIEVLEGRDTQIPMADSNVAAVFAAQAFHWFDVDRALAEIHRVLIPGGGLGLLWNERDESVEWVSDLGRAMQWDRRQPYRVGMDFSEQIRRGTFGDIERRQFAHSQLLDHEALYRRVLSTSYISLMEKPEQDDLMRGVERVVVRLPEPVSLPYVTDVYRARAL